MSGRGQGCDRGLLVHAHAYLRVTFRGVDEHVWLYVRQDAELILRQFPFECGDWHRLGRNRVWRRLVWHRLGRARGTARGSPRAQRARAERRGQHGCRSFPGEPQFFSCFRCFERCFEHAPVATPRHRGTLF
jgi:hypothetical protein